MPDLGANDSVRGWKEAGERGDASAAVLSLSEDVELISPTACYRFEGPEQLHDVLAAAFEVITDMRYHTDVGDASTRALCYHATVAGMDSKKINCCDQTMKAESENSRCSAALFLHSRQ